MEKAAKMKNRHQNQQVYQFQVLWFNNKQSKRPKEND